MARGGTSTAPAFFSDGPFAGFRLPPQAEREKAVESWTLTAEQVDRWLKSAKIGESLVYAHGPTLIDGAAAALVRRLGGEGVLHPFPRRSDDGGFDYVARLLRIRLVRERNPAPPKVDTAMLAVLTLFQEAAYEGRRAPSDEGIAASTGLTPREVKYQVEKLRAAKIIETRTVRAPGEPRYRIVRVLATGAETRGPQ